MSILDVCKGPYYHKADHDEENPLGNLIEASSVSTHHDANNTTMVQFGNTETPGHFKCIFAAFTNKTVGAEQAFRFSLPDGYHACYQISLDSSDKFKFTSYKVENNIGRLSFKFEDDTNTDDKGFVFVFVMKEG